MNLVNIKTDIEFPFSQQKIYSISDREFCEWIKKLFSLENFEITDSSNDTTHEFYIDNDPGGFRKWYREDTEKYISQESVPADSIGYILSHLCGEGLIPCGQYLVRVSW